jgi:hypothetical protein
MVGRMGRMVMLAPLFIVGMAVFMAIGAVIVRALWNWLLPPLFGWHVVTFWQALGILMLSRILFGGLGLHSHGGARARSRMGERWHAMSQEERDRIRKGIGTIFGFGPEPGESRGE